MGRAVRGWNMLAGNLPTCRPVFELLKLQTRPRDVKHEPSAAKILILQRIKLATGPSLWSRCVIRYKNNFLRALLIFFPRPFSACPTRSWSAATTYGAYTAHTAAVVRLAAACAWPREPRASVCRRGARAKLEADQQHQIRLHGEFQKGGRERALRRHRNETTAPPGEPMGCSRGAGRADPRQEAKEGGNFSIASPPPSNLRRQLRLRSTRKGLEHHHDKREALQDAAKHCP